MSRVWTLDVDHRQQLVLLALCDHADDDGGSVFPSIGYLEWKTGYDKRTIQRIMSELRENKVLTVERVAGRNRPTIYRINLDVLPLKKPFERKGDKMSYLSRPPKRMTSGAEKGDTSRSRGDKINGKGDTALSPEPSLEPSTESSENQDAAAKILWDRTCLILKRGMTRQVYRDVFHGTTALHLTQGVLTVRALDSPHRELLTTRWRERIESYLEFLTHEKIQIKFIDGASP